MKDLLSVVIITCNRCKELILAIDSCVKHTNRALEIVVVDNDSTDETKCVLNDYFKDKSQIKFVYKKLDNNMGVAYARNIGYQIATGDILFFIDDDAVVISKCCSLDLVCDYMRRNKEVYACTGVSLDYRYGGQMSYIREHGDNKDDWYSIRSYVGFNHFIKRGFSDDLELYPNNLFYGSEELYVGLKVQKRKGKILFCNEHIVQHNPSSNTRINRRLGFKNGYINTYVIKKYFIPWPLSVVSWLMFLLRLLRFCRGNLLEIISCVKISGERYDKFYNDKFTLQETYQTIKKFGVLKVL